MSRDANAAPADVLPPGRHDPAARRKATRHGRRLGCSIHLAGEELQRAGFALDEPPPFYRVWIDPHRPRVIVNLYREA